MFLSTKSDTARWFERVLLVILGGFISLIGIGAFDSKRPSTEGMVFLIGEHCVEQARDFLAELSATNFSTSLIEVNHDTGEFPQAKYVGSLSHEGLAIEQLKSYASGALAGR